MLRQKPHRAPRLIVRTLAASFTTVFVLLGAVFGVLVLHTREIVQGSVIENLEEGQQLLALVESQRQHEANLQAAVLTETPTLKAALDTYLAETDVNQEPGLDRQALATVQREVSKLAGLLGSDVVAVVEPAGRVLASAGPAAASWPLLRQVTIERRVSAGEPFDMVISLGEERFRVTGAPITLGTAEIGLLLVGARVNDNYAKQLASLARTNIAVVTDGRMVATTLAARTKTAFELAITSGLGNVGTIDLGGEPYTYRRLNQTGPMSFYAVDSIALPTRRISRAALPKLAAIALGALVLSGLASFWLARTTADPIDQFSRELERMAQSPDRRQRLAATGTSAEVDRLVGTFNQLMRSLGDARAETEAAYVGAIRALATALDARDAYTAGHSERVSALSMAIGRKMGLEERNLEVLRLGALLHDIGKIGISDAILCKPSPLTAEEFRVIETHPAVGAQILRSISFLEPHIPIVELHHEQPDGGGYPHGLRGQDIPVLARIVHVADAFDAMTTRRAYREGRPAPDALAELWRYAGTQFDAEVVEVFAAALPSALADLQMNSERRSDNIIQFERKALWA